MPDRPTDRPANSFSIKKFRLYQTCIGPYMIMISYYCARHEYEPHHLTQVQIFDRIGYKKLFAGLVHERILNKPMIMRLANYLHVSDDPNLIYCPPIALEIHHDLLLVKFVFEIY